jgi:hypothetical protein
MRLVIECLLCCVLQAAEVLLRAHRYNEKVDMFALTIMITEIITSYMVPAPRQYLADEVGDMVDAAIAFLEPLCPAMVPLLRAGFSDVPTERPSAVDMLTVLNSAEVLAAIAVSASVTAAVRVLAGCASCVNAHTFLCRAGTAGGS